MCDERADSEVLCVIPYELLLKALEECLKVIHERNLELKGFCVITDRDYELDWKTIKIKFIIKGEHEDLLRVWDELSRKVSQVLTAFKKYVYVEVEPNEEG